MFSRTQTIFSNNTDKNTDIIYYLSTDNYEELKKLMNENNINKIIDSKNNYCALHYAIKFSNVKITDFLLTLGANPDLKTCDKQDAYDLSLKYQNKNIISYVLKQKNNINNEDKKKITLLEKTINEYKENNDYLIKSVDSMINKNEILNQKCEDLTHKCEDLTHKCKDLINKNEDLTFKCKNFTHKCENLTHKYEDSTHKNKLLKKSLTDTDNKIISLKKDVNLLTKEVNSTNDKNVLLENNIKDVTNKLNLEIDGHNKLKRKYKSLDDSFSGLTEGLRKK